MGRSGHLESEILVRVVAPHFVACLIVVNRRCTEAAPILRWAIGKTADELRVYFAKREWQASIIGRHSGHLEEKQMSDIYLQPVHPGRTLASELKARGLTANALALRLQVPANRLSDIIRGERSISAETALRLGRYFGNGGQFWMNLQAQYDLAMAEREFGARIAKEVDAT